MDRQTGNSRRQRCWSMRGLALATALAVTAAAPAQIPCYEVSAIVQGPSDAFGPPNTIATAISPSGEYVVGFYYRFGGDERGWVYRTSTGQFTTLPIPAGFSVCWVNDVNDNGLAVGKLGGTSISRGFTYNLNTNQYEAMLEPLQSGGTCEINAINSSGAVCGYRSLPGPPPDYPFNAFIWSDENGFTDLGVMNGPRSAATNIRDDGVAVGWTGSSDLSLNLDARGFIYDHGKLAILPGVEAGGSAAVAMNDQGLVAGVGRIPVPMFAVRAFIYDTTTDQMQVIAPPPEMRDSQCGDISADGLAVGSFGGPGAEAFAWLGGVVVDLNALVQSDQYGYVFGPVAISNDGWIVSGNGLSSSVLVLRPHERSRADIDANCVVDMDDLLRVLSAWGMNDSAADVDDSGLVDIEDLMFVIDEWNFWT